MKKLIIICGISFAGKSTLGEAIAAADENPLVFCYSDQIESWIAKNISAIS